MGGSAALECTPQIIGLPSIEEELYGTTVFDNTGAEGQQAEARETLPIIFWDAGNEPAMNKAAGCSGDQKVVGLIPGCKVPRWWSSWRSLRPEHSGDAVMRWITSSCQHAALVVTWLVV